MLRLTYHCFIALLVLFSFTGSCVQDDLADFEPCQDYGYNDDVKPIISLKCAIAGCHNGSTSLPNWSDFSVLQPRALDIRSRVVGGSMPPSSSPAGKLTNEQISIISCWVDAGAQNN